jgi:hypothetical protein
MGTVIIRDEKGAVVAMMTYATVYEYKGFFFEVHRYMGPCKLKKNGDPAERQGRRFWKVWEEWDRLSAEEKEKTLVSE